MVGAKLYERGASFGQTLAFLLASPWNSFSLTLILFGLIGWPWSLAFIAGSAVVALATGWIADSWPDFPGVARGWLPPNPNQAFHRERSRPRTSRRPFPRPSRFEVVSGFGGASPLGRNHRVPDGRPVDAVRRDPGFGHSSFRESRPLVRLVRPHRCQAFPHHAGDHLHRGMLRGEQPDGRRPVAASRGTWQLLRLPHGRGGHGRGRTDGAPRYDPILETGLRPAPDLRAAATVSSPG